MQQIEFTYRSTNIDPSISVMLFMRLNGIYIYEKFFDFGREEELSLFTKFPEYEEYKIEEAWESDAQFYVMESTQDVDTFLRTCDWEFFNPKKCVFIDTTKDGFLKELTEAIGGAQYIRYRGNTSLLHDIIDILEPDRTEREFLKNVAEIYCEKKVWQLNLVGKYFYPAETQERFDEVIDAYREVVHALKNKLNMYGVRLGDKSTIGMYIRYAVCNLAYEANLYCIRNKKTQIYWPESIVRPLSQLAGNLKENRFKDSVELLLTQVYDNLMMEPNRAYKKYLEMCREPYSAFCYYKKAEYWIHFGDNTKHAIRYYLHSAVHFPQYYQAWFHLGIAYVQTGEYRRALEAFRNVKVILRNRRYESVLRPIELEYLYRAYCCSGYIQYNCFGDFDMALKEDLGAEKVWSEIDDSRFYLLLDDKEDAEYIKSTIKRQFNIGALYRVIYKLAMKAGDSYLAEGYHKKMQKIENQTIV